VPLLPLVKKLVARGHDVRWYTSARFQPSIEATGARFVRFQSARDVDYHNLNELFPERAALEGLAQGKWDIKFVIDINVEQCRDLVGIAEEDRPDVVVGDTMAFAAGFLAEKLGLNWPSSTSSTTSRQVATRHLTGWPSSRRARPWAV
jgi:UDP:flavonoid glycosyltransferase YjiC (YdhE family)